MMLPQKGVLMGRTVQNNSSPSTDAIGEIAELIALALLRMHSPQSSEQLATASDTELPKTMQQSGYGTILIQSVTS